MDEPVVWTRAGTLIRRHRSGVGKRIGGNLYLHKDYAPYWVWELLGDDWLELEPEVTIIKICKRAVSFISAPDFDTADEPQVAWALTINRKTRRGVRRRYPEGRGPIYHHKWLFVADDYSRFNVAASVERSRTWLALDNVDMSRVGSKHYWDTFVSPRLKEREP